MSLGYSRYSEQPMNDYYSNYPYLERSKTTKTSTFKEEKNLAKSLIRKRLERLNQDKQNYYNFQPPPRNIPTNNNFAKIGYNIMNPNNFDPIHFPIEIPGTGIPPSREPRYELGGPVLEQKKNIKNKLKNKKITDMLLALNFLGYIPKPKRQIEEFLDPEPDVEIPPPPRIPTPPPIIIKKKKKKKKEKMKKPPSKRNWWRLCKEFITLYIFFSTGRKYSTHYAKERTNLIESRTKNVIHELTLIKDWILAIEEPFWNEFRVFEELDLSFSNKDTQNKIKKQSLKIIVMIKKFMENIISKTTKLIDIPERIQEIIYEYIKERAFFPKNYLTTFQTNRMDFEFYGSTRNVSPQRSGMILAFLLICGVLVQQILLHMREIFKEFKQFPNVDVSGKYVGSIIHYLTRDTFINSPKTVTNCIGLFNYYRNYHLYNEQVEKQEDSFKGLLTFEGNENEDEYAEFLIPEEQISQFWNLNAAFVETFRKFIYSWSIKLAKIIKLKFSKNDRNLLPRKRLEKPKNKTIKRRDSSDEEDKKIEKKKKEGKKTNKDLNPIYEEKHIEEEAEEEVEPEYDDDEDDDDAEE